MKLEANRTSITLSYTTGDVVPTERCPGDPPPLQKSCEMPCPEDCVLGEWSSWSSCSHCCSTKQVQGKQTRSRGILAPSGERKTFQPLSNHINTPAGRQLILIIIYGNGGWHWICKTKWENSLELLICLRIQINMHHWSVLWKIIDGKHKQWANIMQMSSFECLMSESNY